MFSTDQHRFYSVLNSVAEVNDKVIPKDLDILQFWTSLWGDSSHHNSAANWIGQVTVNLQNIIVTYWDDTQISTDMIATAARIGKQLAQIVFTTSG